MTDSSWVPLNNQQLQDLVARAERRVEMAKEKGESAAIIIAERSLKSAQTRMARGR